MKINVIKGLESVAMVLLMVSFISGCCKVGKGARVEYMAKAPKPYPVVTNLNVTTTRITYTTTWVEETTTTESALEVENSTSEETAVVDIGDPMVFITENEETNIEEVANVDVTETTFDNDYSNGYPSVTNGYITEEERIFLCNTVGTEYGSDWVSLYDKALVVDTVMTRVEEGCWTNGLESTVYNVITAPNQYNPWYAEAYYHDCVTQSCIDAVEYYFQHRDEFPHYDSFYGDGVENHFYNN